MTPKPKKFPCSAPGCITLVVGESLCERHVGEFSKAYRVCSCKRAPVISLANDRCDKCNKEYEDFLEYGVD